MNLIDTHAHLYLDNFEEDRMECIHRAREKGIEEVYLPNIDRETISPLLVLEGEYPDFCHAMMGLHPCSVKEDWTDQVDEMEERLEQRSFAAIGEIGMDLHWDTTFRDEQEKAFRRQLGWAKYLDYPVVIHNRKATDELLNIVREEQDGRLRGIFHCFTGSADEGKEMIDLNFYLGIGGILTFENSDLGEQVKQLPLSRMVLETDAPYLAPHPNRGQRNESSFLSLIHSELAEVMHLEEEKVAETTTQNARSIYRSGSNDGEDD